LFDALMLGVTCNKTAPRATASSAATSSTTTPPSARAPVNAAPQNTLYVSASTGSDSNKGTQSNPLKTLTAAVLASRSLGTPKAIMLAAGTYYEGKTVELTAADSDLTIAAVTGAEDKVWLTGAAPLPAELSWEKFKVTAAVTGTLDAEVGANNQKGCSNAGATHTNPGCTCHANVTAASQCQATCQALGPSLCTSFGWSGEEASRDQTQDNKDGWLNQCCIRSDGVWHPVTQTAHVSGHWSGARAALNIWKTQLPAGMSADQLRVDGNRSPRARYPNGNPETDQWPIGWVPDAQEWLPANTPPNDLVLVNVTNAAIADRGSTTFDTYIGGIGGPCSHFTPPFSYWCSLHPSGGGGFQYYVPSGMVWTPGSFPDDIDFANVSKAEQQRAVFQVWRRSHWANWMFEVDEIDASSSTIKFGRGGFQGSRGGPGSDWYLENMLTLLDAPNEHYYDPDTGMLYYSPNSTDTSNTNTNVNTNVNNAPPSPTLELAAPTLMTLLQVNATQANPVKGLTIQGIGFRDAAPTFLEPHGIPSGGDWALERMGALFFEGTVDLKVAGCQFQRLDGNGLMLSGFNRYASILENHFAWTGDSAIAAWGRTDELSDNGVNGWDGTAGDFPWHTLVQGNVIRETGVWEKQSSCWFQAKTAQTVLKENLCFNLGRAGFNFNDGFGGGDFVYQNLIFNSNRESADHGPINSWDRQPYVTNVATGKPSGLMLPRNITNNFLVANYGGSNGAIDNDDGSEYYENNHNFQIYGHQKFKVGAIHSYGNVMAYLSGYGESWKSIGNIPTDPHAMHDNIVVFQPSSGPRPYHNCDPWKARNNSLWAGGKGIVISGANCNRGNFTLAEWQARDPANNDVGSTFHNSLPSGAQIITWARTLIDV